MKLEDLIGNLQTYEMKHGAPKKKSVAFKVSKNLPDTSDESSKQALESLEYIESLQSELALIAKKYKKFFRKGSTSHKKHDEGKFHSSRKTSDKSYNPKCYECEEYGHIAPNCPNRKSNKKFFSKTKAMAATWSDSSSDDDVSEVENEDNQVYALMVRRDVSNEIVEDTEDEDESKSDNSESECEETLQEAFNNLYKDFIRVGSKNKKLEIQNKNLLSEIQSLKLIESSCPKNIEVEMHTENLESKIFELNELIDDLKGKNENLKDKDRQYNELKIEFEKTLEDIMILKEKLGSVEKMNMELTAKIDELEKLNSKFLGSRKKLDEMLSIGKSYHDKTGLGFLSETANNLNPKRKSIHVTPRLYTQQNTQRSNKRSHLPKPNSRTFHCYYCGIRGHKQFECKLKMTKKHAKLNASKSTHTIQVYRVVKIHDEPWWHRTSRIPASEKMKGKMPGYDI